MKIQPGALGRLLVVAAVTGCAAGDNSTLLDTGLAPLDVPAVDTGVDVSPTDGPDVTPVDAGRSETGTDVPTADTGMDGGMDVSAITDAGTDVSVVTDAGVDVPVRTDTGTDVPGVTDTGVDVPVRMDTGTDVPGVTDTGVDVPVRTDTGTDVAVGGCDVTHPCGTGQTCCAGRCTNVQTDPANCGTCGTVCGTGLCGTQIAAPMDTLPANWVFNGTASWDSAAQSGVLTPVATGQLGTLWYRNPIVGDAFDASFEFRIGGGTRADGMAFAIQRTGATAMGRGGGGFGVVGLDGYAVELDDFNNLTCGDGDGNHTAVDSLGICDTAVNTPNFLMVSPDLFPTVGDIADGTWRTCTVHVETAGGSTRATVTINRIPATAGVGPILSNVTLTGATAGAAYWFGFGGATGGLTNRHEVRHVTVTFPTARCL